MTIQALSYSLGHLLWTFFERGMIKEFFERSNSSKDLASNFKKTLGRNSNYVFKMLVFEVLLMIIVVANYVFTNWYLSWKFWAFGFLDVATKVFPNEGKWFYITNTIRDLDIFHDFDTFTKRGKNLLYALYGYHIVLFRFSFELMAMLVQLLWILYHSLDLVFMILSSNQRNQ